MSSRHEFEYNRGYGFENEKEEPKKAKKTKPMPEDKINQEEAGWEDFRESNEERDSRWSE